MKKIISILSLLAMTTLLISCGGRETAATSSDAAAVTVPDNPGTAASDETRAIYWYMCGSDLESEHGAATDDLAEMMEVTLPDHVKVIIQTGGASEWQNNTMDASKIQRWLYDSEGMYLIDEQPIANMGDPQTLTDFLAYATDNYPADRTAVILWDHGGGSVNGVCADELYEFDALELPELYTAFRDVWQPDESDPALELIGFDACLMATVDVADTFREFAHYMVASEETEPGNGWLYSGWLSALAEDPSMEGDELGKAICDAYYEGCVEEETADLATLSLTDLSKINSLLDAYDLWGQEAFTNTMEDPSFLTQFGRAASESENYGGNTREQGFYNLVDLGHLAAKTASFLPSARSVLDALQECVLYKVNGDYRSESTGLSCYYSYNGDTDDYDSFAALGTSPAFRYLYSFALTGELGEGSEQYLDKLNIREVPEITTIYDTDWSDMPLTLDEESGSAILNLGPDAESILSGLDFLLFRVDEENDEMLLLGTDNDISADLENGIFYDNFRGVWGSIDGHLTYMELSFEGEDYNLYSVPILLNGESYNLQVSYDFNAMEWSIIGAAPELDESGMASKELRILEPGDEITTLWWSSSYSDEEDDFVPYEVDTFPVTETTSFGETELPDGSYVMIFEMWDAVGNCVYSDQATFDCEDGEIYTTVYEYEEDDENGLKEVPSKIE